MKLRMLGLALMLAAVASIAASAPGPVVPLGDPGATPEIARDKCEEPVNWKNCAHHCDDLKSCKKCCANGEFPDNYYNKCVNRCETTFGLTDA
ncbi:MAG: hypothetical protein ACE5E1_03335 [Phycisphaerae bacterium]